jgi:hypothetical protein
MWCRYVTSALRSFGNCTLGPDVSKHAVLVGELDSGMVRKDLPEMAGQRPRKFRYRIKRTDPTIPRDH